MARAGRFASGERLGASEKKWDAKKEEMRVSASLLS
jgi:hypothetical protein